jgi:MEMO1 family protein
MASPEMIREPAVAGQFYSADARNLKRTLQSLLRPPAHPIAAKAVLSPHAGYVYSGSVAGAVFSSVQVPDRFIILGPNHTGIGLPLSLYPSGEWRTPLGLAPIDSELNDRLLQECRALREDWTAHAHEHSLEVQIPFLQTLMPGFRFSAICVGTTSYPVLEELGHALARVLASVPEPVLIIASSDMNHYESAAVSARKDRWAIEQLVALDPAGLFQVVGEKSISMCGFAPAVATLTACRDLGCSKGILVQYANSGDVSGDNERVVGYAGMALV